MSQVHIVIAVKDSDIICVETFSTIEQALARGFKVAHELAGYNVNADPGEEFLPDGSRYFRFLNNIFKTVAVFSKEADSPIHLPPTPAPAPYDFMDATLPVGWFQNGKPALMSDLLNNPFDIKDPLWDLTEAQKWALIEVRVRRSPSFHSPIGTLDHARALTQLQGKTPHGEMLVQEEIEALHALREDLMAGVHSS